MKRSMAQNLSSSFTHAGYLRGKAKKERVIPNTGPAATAYAMLLAYLSGKRGRSLLSHLTVNYLTGCHLSSNPMPIMHLYEDGYRTDLLAVLSM